MYALLIFGPDKSDGLLIWLSLLALFYLDTYHYRNQQPHPHYCLEFDMLEWKPGKEFI